MVLDAIMQKSQLPYYAAVSFAQARGYLIAPEHIHFCNARTVVVALLPYFPGDWEGEISLYAQGMDYHKVLGRRLARAARLLEIESGCAAQWGCDRSAFDEVKLAAAAGLGIVGRNGLLLHRELGSLVFIGEIITQAELSSKPMVKPEACIHCMACVCACPTGALNGGFHAHRCASAVGQKKGEVDERERKIVRSAGYVWGCDHCQRVCPYNTGSLPLGDSELISNRLQNMEELPLEQLSNRAFLRQYGNRAFSWRGRDVLVRNRQLLHSAER